MAGEQEPRARFDDPIAAIFTKLSVQGEANTAAQSELDAMGADDGPYYVERYIMYPPSTDGVHVGPPEVYNPQTEEELAAFEAALRMMSVEEIATIYRFWVLFQNELANSPDQTGYTLSPLQPGQEHVIHKGELPEYDPQP